MRDLKSEIADLRSEIRDLGLSTGQRRRCGTAYLLAVVREVKTARGDLRSGILNSASSERVGAPGKRRTWWHPLRNLNPNLSLNERLDLEFWLVTVAAKR